MKTYEKPIISIDEGLAECGKANVTVNASTATFSYYNAPETHEAVVQVNGNINNLKVKGYTYTTA